MKTKFQNILNQFENSIQKNANYKSIINLFRKLQIPPKPTAQELTSLYQLMYKLLDYGENKNIHPFFSYTCKEHIRECAIEKFERTLYNDTLRNGLIIPWNKNQAEINLKPLFDFYNYRITKGYNSIHIEWKVLTKGYPVFKKIFRNWIKELEIKGFKQEGYSEGFELAIKLDRLAEKQDYGKHKFSWQYCKKKFLPLLDKKHILVRAGAAKNLGYFYRYISENEIKKAPSLPEMLEIIKQKEIKNAGVTGPFLNGLSYYGISALHDNETLEKENFDVASWVLEILRKSKIEPYFPNAQPLWFYAHEYFCYRPEAVEELMEMGREELAIESATDHPGKVEGMKPVLLKLTKSKNKNCSRWAKFHLKKYY